MTIFGPAWGDLSPDAIEEFLGDAEEESLTWEAKGTAWPNAGSVRKHACGFANRIGGYLLIGVERDEATGRWSAPGVPTEHSEPEMWLEDIIGRLRPAPYVRAKAWGRSAGRTLALAAVDPVIDAPCMTPEGLVYERVAGATIPVTDPARLSELQARGLTARADAAQHAEELAFGLIAEPPVGSVGETVFAVALVSLGQPDDAATRPFRDSYYGQLVEAVEGNLQPDPMIRSQAYVTVDQRSITAGLPGRVFTSGADSWRPDYMWSVRLTTRTGSAVSFGALERETSLDQVVRSGIERAWKFAADRLAEMGGHGPIRLHVTFNKFCESLREISDREIDFGEWLPSATPTEEMLATIGRKVMRGAGRLELEPTQPSPTNA